MRGRGIRSSRSYWGSKRCPFPGNTLPSKFPTFLKFEVEFQLSRFDPFARFSGGGLLRVSGLSLFGLAGRLPRGSLPLQSRRMCTARPGYQLENTSPTRVRQADLSVPLTPDPPRVQGLLFRVYCLWLRVQSPGVGVQISRLAMPQVTWLIIRRLSTWICGTNPYTLGRDRPRSL